MSENILLVSEDKSNLEFLFSDVPVLRRFETVSVVPLMNVKRAISGGVKLVLINEKEYFHPEVLKTVEMIKRVSPDTYIIILLFKNDYKFVQECIDKGVYDFIHCESSKSELNLRLLNLFKFISLEDKFRIMTIFLNSTSSVNSKTGLYTHKALKECYYYLREFRLFQTASYVVLGIDSGVKTKVSMNRLGLNLKKTLRQTDVIAQGLGKYYLLLPETDMNGASAVMEKIADTMGGDIKLHAGIAVSGIESFDELEKNANDSFKSAIVNDELYVCLGGLNIDENLSETFGNDKHFKLFQKVFDKKLKDIIEPVFYRTEKDFQTKLEDVLISQYANKIECVFSIKDGNKHSELVIHYDGFAKFNLKITHNGLDTCEDTNVVIQLNMLSEKILKKYLTQLYNEFDKD